MRRVVLAVFAVLLLQAGAAVAVIFSGVYDISALSQHTVPVQWALQTTMINSIREHAEDVAAPELTPTMAEDGAGHYARHCVQCHGAPGVAPDPFALGMTPVPTNLVQAARRRSPAELYWAVAKGIKMSGMPAWEFRLSDADIWETVAFVRRMALMTAPEYRRAIAEAPDRPGREERPDPVATLDGDPVRGGAAIHQFACVTCHRVPGIVGTDAHVGPPLAGIAERRYIAGVVLNTPENMVRWLLRPQEIDPLTTMPDMGLTPQQAHDIAAYLYSLD